MGAYFPVLLVWILLTRLFSCVSEEISKQQPWRKGLNSYSKAVSRITRTFYPMILFDISGRSYCPMSSLDRDTLTQSIFMSFWFELGTLSIKLNFALIVIVFVFATNQCTEYWCWLAMSSLLRIRKSKPSLFSHVIQVISLQKPAHVQSILVAFMAHCLHSMVTQQHASMLVTGGQGKKSPGRLFIELSSTKM